MIVDRKKEERKNMREREKEKKFVKFLMSSCRIVGSRVLFLFFFFFWGGGEQGGGGSSFVFNRILRNARLLCI